MNAKKDYYEILGINKSSTEAEIKGAYKKLAREHHPDVVKDGDKVAAEKRFKEINEAYQMLSDPQKRKMYDQYGHAGFANGTGASANNAGYGGQGFGGGWGPFTYTYSNGGGQGANNFGGDFDPFDVFEEIFGFRGYGGARAPKKGKNLYYELHIDFAEAVHGAEKKIKAESGEINVKIPQGIHDGSEMKFSGKGMPGPQGTPNGDLFLTFRVTTPRPFQRAGADLGIALEIDFITAILGDTVDVAVIDPSSKTGIGTAKLKIPQGTQQGARFKLSGKGMPKLQSSGFGDVIVQVFITIPKKLSKKQKETLEKYKDLS